MVERAPEGPQEDPTDSHDESEERQPSTGSAADVETLRAAVEERYDFEHFRPADMAEMSLEEWEAAFDPDTWITGEALLNRVEAELLNRVDEGQLFAVVDRQTVDGEPGLLVYTDAEYVVVRSDGTVEGHDGIAQDVEPIVALCSMESFDVAEPPENAGLPDPDTIEPGAGDLGHRLLLGLAGVQLVAGVVILLAPLFVRLGPGAGALTTVVGLAFLVVGLVLGLLVANARLSDRFRAAEYRDRLQAAGVGRDERPAFLPTVEGQDDGPDPSNQRSS